MKPSSFLPLAAALCAGAPTAPAHAAELDTTPFAYRVTITVSGYTGASTLTNFPVLVKLGAGSPTGFDYADCATDGSDLRFADVDGNLIPHEVESWNTNGESFVWVRLPTLAGTATTFTAYFGTNGVSSLPEVFSTNVWTRYAAVFHGGASIADATGKSATVTPQSVSAATSGGRVGGAMTKGSGKGFTFSNPVTSGALGSIDNFSFSGWFKKSAGSTAVLFSNKGRSEWNGNGFLALVEGGNYFSVGVGVDGAGGHQPNSNTGKGKLAVGTWGHLAFSYDKSVTRLDSYFNGENIFGTDSARIILDPAKIVWSLGGFQDDAANCFQGTMDELRVFNGSASADWLKAEYDSVADPASFAVAAPPTSIHAPVLGACAASVAGNDATFSVQIKSLTAPASVSVFYRAEGESSFTVLPLGTASAAGTTITATISDLGIDAYVWYAQAVSAIGGTDHAARTPPRTFAITHARDPAAAYRCFTATIGYEGAAVADVPVLLRLSETAIDGFSYDDVTASGLEILDGNGNLLPYEIDTWNTNGESLVWVLAPSFSNGAELTVRYGTEFPNPSFPASDVWTGYVGVWHMNEILEDSATGTHYTPDSSASGWHAYKAVEADEVPAPVTNAVGATAHPVPLTGTAMDIAYNTGKEMTDLGGFIVPASQTASTTLNGPGFTLSAIVNSQQVANNGRCRAIAFGNAYNDMANFAVGSDKIYCMGSSSHNKAHAKGKTGWVCATDVFGSPSFIYSDGVNISGSGGNPNLTSLTLSKGIGLGCLADGQQCLDGYLDEARIRNAASTADYIAAEYAAMTDASVLSFSRVSVVDAATPVLSVPTVARNEDGSFTLKVVVSENAPAAGTVQCTIGGANYVMASGDSTLPMTFSATVSNLAAGTCVATVRAESATGNAVYADCPTVFHAGPLVASVVSDADEGSLTPGVFRISRADADPTDLPALTFDVAFSGDGLDAVVPPGVTTLTIPAGAASVDLAITPVFTETVAADVTIVLTVSGTNIGMPSTATMTVVDADYDTAVRYVAMTGDDANHGGTPELPKKTIAAAVKSLANVAQSRACTVHVAPGLYPTNPQIYVTNAISIVGADVDPSRTVVSNSFTTGWEHKRQRCFYINHPDARIANLTLQKGGVTDQQSGGTLYIGSRGGLATNCIVEGGTTLLNSYAGGAHLDGGLVTHTIFRNNQSGCSGGSWQGSNKAGVLSLNGSSRAENCLFVQNNQAVAVVLVHLYGSSVMRNCTIVDSALSTTNAYCQSWSALVVDSGATAQNVVIAGVTNKVDGAACPPTGTRANFKNGALDSSIEGTSFPTNTVTGTAAAFFPHYAENVPYELKYRPKSSGLLADKGANYTPMAAFDLSGTQKRLVGSRVDIGCYEANGAGTMVLIK